MKMKKENMDKKMKAYLRDPDDFDITVGMFLLKCLYTTTG